VACPPPPPAPLWPLDEWPFKVESLAINMKLSNSNLGSFGTSLFSSRDK